MWTIRIVPAFFGRAFCLNSGWGEKVENGNQDVPRKESSKQRKNDLGTKIQKVRHREVRRFEVHGETDVNVHVKEQQKKAITKVFHLNSSGLLTMPPSGYPNFRVTHSELGKT